MRFFFRTFFIAGLVGGFASLGATQTAKRPGHGPAGASDIDASLKLAESGHCKEAIPRLLRLTHTASKGDLARRIGFDGLGCARVLNEDEATVEFLLFLNHKFPRDPAVLYVSTHAYSDLSLKTSEKLLAIAPHSIQAMMLEAESLEVQGKWKPAKDEYRKILEKYPHATGVHIRIARADLSESPSAETVADAKKQLEEELKDDPTNAAAEDLLGGIAMRAEDWNEAIKRFSQATKMDAGMTDAYLGLGMALNSAGRFSEAIAPLKTAEKRLPEQAEIHYQLLMAYSRLGRKQDAAHEMALFRELSQKAAEREKGRIQGEQDVPHR